jgi:pimeloyl-ACP methyl ester carboxylesterase
MLATHEWKPASRTPPPRLAVLVHGVTGWHRTWWRVGPALAARGWRVVAVDQRGHGNSPRINGFTTIPELADDLATTIEGIGAPADALIGHSLGAAVSAELAFTRPELARRLVLEDPPAVTRADDVAWHENLDRQIRAAGDDPEGEVRRERAENPSWQDEDVIQDVEGRALADREGLLATFRRDTGAGVLDLAPMLAAPALYLLATEERSAFPAEPRRRLEATLPSNARLVVLDAGHTIHRDRFDEWMAVVTDWLEPAA